MVKSDEMVCAVLSRTNGTVECPSVESELNTAVLLEPYSHSKFRQIESSFASSLGKKIIPVKNSLESKVRTE